MTSSTIQTVKRAIKYWWVSLLAGVIFILAGIWVLKTPLESYLALSILFSLVFFISGVFEVVYALANSNQLKGWGWTFAGGIIDILLGLMLLSNPALSMAILPFFVGFAIMFRSFMAVGMAFELRSFGIGNWGWLLALAIGGLLFSFILLIDPVFAGATIVVWTALAFISIGLFRIFLSFKLKGLDKFI